MSSKGLEIFSFLNQFKNTDEEEEGKKKKLTFQVKIGIFSFLNIIFTVNIIVNII